MTPDMAKAEQIEGEVRLYRQWAELAFRCEAAASQHRHLDEAIAFALGWTPISNPTNAGGLVGRWYQPNGEMSGMDGPPLYTHSVDAAIPLVPEGMVFNLGSDSDRGAWAHVWLDVDYDGRPHAGYGTTPALALCAAALRARAKARGDQS